MTKLAVITDEISQDIEQAVAVCREFDVSGIEIRSVWEKGPHELSDNEIHQIRKLADKNNLRVPCIASPVYKSDFGNDAEDAEHLDILDRCLWVAKQLNAEIVRVFTFWRKESTPANWEAIADKFQKPIAAATKAGIILGVENEPTTNATNGRETSNFVRNINHPNLRVVWDPGNDVFDPEREVPYPDGYESVRDLICHVHLKDGNWDDTQQQFQAVPLGEGEVDYLAQLNSLLLKDNYQGWLSLETHYRPKIQLNDEIVQRPKGSQFSADGEAGTRECLANLNAMLRIVNCTDPRETD